MLYEISTLSVECGCDMRPGPNLNLLFEVTGHGAKKVVHKLRNHFNRICFLILRDDIAWIHEMTHAIIN